MREHLRIVQSEHETEHFFHIRRSLFLSIVCFGCAMSFLIAWIEWNYQHTLTEGRVASFVAGLDADAVDAVWSDDEIVRSDGVKKIQSALSRLDDLNTDVGGIVFVGRKADGATVIADSRMLDSGGLSPGGLYPDTGTVIQRVFTDGRFAVSHTGFEDWIPKRTGAIVVDEDGTGALKTALVVTFDARRQYGSIVTHAVVPLLLTVIALLVVLGGQYLRRSKQVV